VRAAGYALGVLLAAGALGCGGEDGGEETGARSVPEQRPADPLSVEILGHDLHPEGPPTLNLGDSFTLHGLASNEPGTGAVDLYASPYPHRHWRRIASRGPTGELTFRVRPQINTKYQLRLARHPEVRSLPLKIHVDLRARMKAGLPAPGTTEIEYAVRARRPIEPGGARVWFYMHEDSRGPMRRVATGRPRQAGPTSIVATGTYSDPDPRRGDRFFGCVVGLVARGFGHPSSSDPECGQRVIAATKRRFEAPP
jgi:hypothetical protein